MSEINRLRMELKADLELMVIHQGAMAAQVDEIGNRLDGQGRQIAGQGDRIAEQGEQIAEQGRRIAEQGQRIAEQAAQIRDNSLLIQQSMQETARLGREVAEGSRWMQGRMRLLHERFDAILGALEHDHTEDRALLYDLRERVSRLEQDRPPAA